MELIWTLNEKCVNLIEFHISFLAAVQESASFAIAKLTIFHTFFFCTTSRSLILTLRARSLLTKILSRFSHEMEKNSSYDAILPRRLEELFQLKIVAIISHLVDIQPASLIALFTAAGPSRLTAPQGRIFDAIPHRND